MIRNATIESLKAVTGIAGDGDVVLAAESLSYPIPCELISPKSYRVETDRQRQIQNDAMVRVDCSALSVSGHRAEVGDRIVIKRSELDAVLESYEVSDLSYPSVDVVELTLMVRDDGAGEES